jgi:hypothetical protein
VLSIGVESTVKECFTAANLAGNRINVETFSHASSISEIQELF